MSASWAPVDLGAVLEEIASGIDVRPRPTVLSRADGQALFYAGRVNGVHGESGSGKTWIALLACVQVMSEGKRVAYVDHEGDARSVVGRLLELGVTPETVRAQFAYVQPEEPFGDGEPLMSKIRTGHPALVVIDSTGEGLALHGARANADEEVARWFATVPRRIANEGPAVVVLDHSPKAASSDLWPIGSQRKRAAINGAQYYVETISPFNRARAGAAKIVCAKDRHGIYRTGEKVAILQVDPADDHVRLTLTVPEAVEAGETFRPTGFMERISRLLEQTSEGLSLRSVQARTTGKTDHIRLAVDILVAEGYVEKSLGARGAHLHTSVKPFREGAQSSGSVGVDFDRDRALPTEGGTGHSQSSVSERTPGTVGHGQGTVTGADS